MCHAEYKCGLPGYIGGELWLGWNSLGSYRGIQKTLSEHWSCTVCP